MITRSNLSQPVYKETIETVRISSAIRLVVCLGLRGCVTATSHPTEPGKMSQQSCCFFPAIRKSVGPTAHTVYCGGMVREKARVGSLQSDWEQVSSGTLNCLHA